MYEETTLTTYEQYQRYFNIEMRYGRARNNRVRGYQKKVFAVVVAARMGFISPLTCEKTWELSRQKTLEFLNKLVDDKLLALAKTDRAKESRIYVPTRNGIVFAAEVMRLEIPFRSSAIPLLQVNQNAIMHDSILSYVLHSGLHNKSSEGIPKPLWTSYITESEFKRLHSDSGIKHIDALVKLKNGEVAAIELENSFKRKQQHAKTLLQFKESLLSEKRLYDKIFIVPCSDGIRADTQRFYEQLLTELPERIDRATKRPLLTQSEARLLREKIIFRTKFIETIENTFYR